MDHALMAEYLERVHLGFAPRDSEVRGALAIAQYLLQEPEFFTKDNAIGLAFGNLERHAQVIAGMHWSLEVARKPRLITSDAPLVLWRTPTYRDNFEGFGLGNAEEVRFPLNPGMQLVLTRQQREPVRRIEPNRVWACNADLALASYQVIIGHPRRLRQLKLLDLPARRPVQHWAGLPHVA